jgi:hypothetical protein
LLLPSITQRALNLGVLGPEFVAGVGFTVGGAVAVGTALAVSIVARVMGATAVAGAIASTFAISVAGAVASSVGLDNDIASDLVVVVTFVVAVTFPITFAISKISEKIAQRGCLGLFWTIFWPGILSIEFQAITGASHANAGQNAFSLMFLLGLIPVINTPFAWLSVAVTRTLLRRACVAGSAWWQMVLGLADVMVGLVLLLGLAIALTISLRWADHLVINGGVAPVVDACAILRQIRAGPDYSGNYWAYGIIFVTLIPSFANMIFGAAGLILSLFRGVRSWVVRQIGRSREGAKRAAGYVAEVAAACIGIATLLAGALSWMLLVGSLQVAPSLSAFVLRSFLVIGSCPR